MSAPTPALLHAGALDEGERRRHEQPMRRALELARRAPGGPFGARESGGLVAEGANQSDQSPLLYAEIVALLACDDLRSGGGALTLYSSAEPCPMCASAIAWSGIDELVYATSIATLTRLGIPQIAIDSAEIARAAQPLALNQGRLVAGVLEAEGDARYRQWAESLPGS